MKAMVLTDISNVGTETTPLRYTDIDVKPPQADEILIQVKVCGACHTELDQIEGRIKPSLMPVVPGHQIIGRVHKTGKDVVKFSQGDRVGVAWIHSSCGECVYCLGGKENLCGDFKSTGKDVNGGYAEYHTAKQDFAFHIPESIEDIYAAPLLCAGSIGYRALKLSEIENGDNIGLMGFGASGHLVIKLVQAVYPGSDVYVFSRNKEERELALSSGAVWTGEVDEKSPKDLSAVIDTTPAWKPVVESLKNLKPSGRLVINAIRKDSSDIKYLSSIDYASHLWMEKEIKSVTNLTRNDVTSFIDLAGKFKIKPTVNQYKLKEANEALTDLKFGRKVGAKVLTVN